MAKKSTPEDAFYDNLTLGLMKTLSGVPRVCNVSCEKRQPCEKAQVTNWEQRHCVYLPEDMKKFYLSTDGFKLHWSYQYATNDVRRVGLIHFPHLLQITLLRENLEPTAIATVSSSDVSKTSTNTLVPTDRWGHFQPVITTKTKVFELNNVNDIAKVCLMYENSSNSSPQIYLLELNSCRFQFLAETFSEYLRMAIAHLGLPYWELCFSSCGLPAWTEQLFLLLAPHLLEEHEPRFHKTISPASEYPYNVIDPNIFRLKSKTTSKTKLTSKN